MKQRPHNAGEKKDDPPNAVPDGGAFSAGRRNAILLTGVSFALLSTPRWMRQASAQTQASPPAASASPPQNPANQQQTNFLALSALLTGTQKLNPRTGTRIYAALSTQAIEFEKQVAALWQYALDHQIKDVDNLAAAVGSDSALSLVLHRIISAWYLGVVGDDGVTGGAKVVSFESALMFDQVRDAVVVPTYCRAAPGYWVTQPAVLKAGV